MGENIENRGSNPAYCIDFGQFGLYNIFFWNNWKTKR
jgi:hypothetical protein